MADIATALLKGLGLAKEDTPPQQPINEAEPWNSEIFRKEATATAGAPPPPVPQPPPMVESPVQPADEAAAIAEQLKKRNEMMAPWGQTGMP